MRHVLWTNSIVENACYLNPMKGYSKRWKIQRGRPVAEEFPSDVTFEMDQNFPDNTLTPDFLRNVNGMVIVSQRIKELLDAKEIPQVEHLPVGIIDQKGKRLKDPYFVINPTTVLSALRLDDCEATRDSMDANGLESLKKLSVDEDVLAAAPPLFRVQLISEYVWIRSDLAKAMDVLGFDGNRWIDPEAIATGERLPNLSTLPEEANARI